MSSNSMNHNLKNVRDRINFLILRIQNLKEQHVLNTSSLSKYPSDYLLEGLASEVI